MSAPATPIARVHNARGATRDDSDCWLGTLRDAPEADGYRPVLAYSGEYATEAAAVAWCRDELARRGHAGAPLEVSRAVIRDGAARAWRTA